MRWLPNGITRAANRAAFQACPGRLTNDFHRPYSERLAVWRVYRFPPSGALLMKTLNRSLSRAVPAALLLTASTAMAQGTPAQAQQPQQPMSFFVTSVGKGAG